MMHDGYANQVYGADFRIVRRLGAGGMGKVFVAEQMSTGKRRALKLMAPELVCDPKMRAHFALEAHAASIVDSDHVVDVIAAGVEPSTGEPWLAMELLDGEDLAQLVERHGPRPVAEAAEIVAQLCHGLGAAHAHGLVHRDLKPDNVFVAEARRTGVPFTVKVLDFGIASLCAGGASIRASRSIGTPLWMAPEQATLDAPITAATDVWALGLVVYWLFTGKTYWRSGNDDRASMSTLLTEVLFSPLVPASARAVEQGAADALPAGFDAWFAACVARDPKMRFADARAAGEAFVRMVTPSARTAAAVPVTPHRPARRVLPPPRTHRWLYVVALVIGIGTPFGVFHPHRTFGGLTSAVARLTSR